MEQGQLQSTWPKQSDVALVPYVKIDDAWTVPNDVIRGLAEQFQKEGTFGLVFFEGYIKSPADFLEAMQAPGNVPVLVYAGHGPVGIAWLQGVGGSIAFAHFCFLKRTWGRQSLEIGRLLLKYWMSFQSDGGAVLDTIIGNIPTMNSRAISYVRKIGFRLLGDVPRMMRSESGERRSATILYYSRFADVKVSI